MDLATTLKRARQRAGLSQAQLAALLVTARSPRGVWSTYVGQIESGSKVPAEETCLRLAQVLDLEPHVLLLAACRARARHGPAQDFLAALQEVAGAAARKLPPTLGAPAEEAQPAAAEGGTVLAGEPWPEVVRQLGRLGRLPELAALLDDLGCIDDRAWEGLRGLLQAPARRDRGRRDERR